MFKRLFRKKQPKTVIVVSGLPRSGTSMMMKMLEAGGIPPLQDGVRTAGRGGRNINELAVKKGVKPAHGNDARNPQGLARDDVNVVALCDVDRRNLGKAADMFPQARTYEDFRKLFDNAGDIDAVVVSTTEHTHAYAVLPALQLRKHVYCEKPITHNVVEARLLAEEAARAGVATQMGTQIHGMPNYRRVVELIQSGAIGKVREAHTWVSRAWGLQSKAEAEANNDRVFVTERPSEAMTPPEYLNWELWLGPGTVPAVPRSLLPRSEVVPLVGFWQRHDVGSGKSLERPRLVGPQARCAADD